MTFNKLIILMATIFTASLVFAGNTGGSGLVSLTADLNSNYGDASGGDTVEAGWTLSFEDQFSTHAHNGTGPGLIRTDGSIDRAGLSVSTWSAAGYVETESGYEWRRADFNDKAAWDQVFKNNTEEFATLEISPSGTIKATAFMAKDEVINTLSDMQSNAISREEQNNLEVTKHSVSTGELDQVHVNKDNEIIFIDSSKK